VIDNNTHAINKLSERATSHLRAMIDHLSYHEQPSALTLAPFVPCLLVCLLCVSFFMFTGRVFVES